MINLMVEFEMIYLYKLKGVSAYFIPSNLYFQPEKLELQQEFYMKKSMYYCIALTIINSNL
jgi:hypothetical protein